MPEDIALEIRQVSPVSTEWKDMRRELGVDVGRNARIARAVFEVRAEYRPVPATVLLPGYPNPFNPEVRLPFELAEPANVQIRIHNVLGQEVRRLDLGPLPAGRYTGPGRAARWDGRNEQGMPVSSGMYFGVLHAGERTAVQKMTLIR